MLILEGTASVCLLVYMESVCVCVYMSAELLTSLNTDKFILMNNTLMTFPNRPNTLKKFAFREYQC